MNIWSEILSPALLALLYTTLFAIPAWALFRWLLQKEWLGLLERSIRLFIILITVIIFFGSGGKAALAVLQSLIGSQEPDAVPTLILTRLADTAVILIAAFFFARLIDTLIFEFYLSNRDEAVPKLLRDALRLVIIVVALVFILIIIFEVNAVAVGGSAAVITVVLGLALQNILGDLFSGVVLQFERPFRQGDWVEIGEHEGEVVELNWRAIRLKTRQHVGVVIPNSVIAKAEIRNFNLATPSVAVRSSRKTAKKLTGLDMVATPSVMLLAESLSAGWHWRLAAGWHWRLASAVVGARARCPWHPTDQVHQSTSLCDASRVVKYSFRLPPA